MSRRARRITVPNGHHSTRCAIAGCTPPYAATMWSNAVLVRSIRLGATSPPPRMAWIAALIPTLERAHEHRGTRDPQDRELRARLLGLAAGEVGGVDPGGRGLVRPAPPRNEVDQVVCLGV